MTSVPLRDQLGVVGIIDQFRHQEQRVNDYLDSRRQQDELRQKLIDYYANQGVAVSEDAISQGIAQWYQNRLRFEPSVLPWYAKLYVTRGRWFKPLLFVSLIIGIAAWAFDATMRHSFERDLKQQQAAMASWEASFDDLSSQLNMINVPQPLETDPALVRRLILEANNQYNHARELNNNITKQGDLSPVLAAKKRLTNTIDMILSTRMNFETWPLIRTQNASLFSRFETLVQLHQRGFSLFSLPDSSVSDLDALLQELHTMLRRAQNTDSTIKELLTLQTTISDSGMQGDELLDVLGMVQSAISASERLEPVKAETMAYLHYVSSVAPLQLTLRVNPQNGLTSALERTHHDSGNKAYYAVAQAISPTGDAEPLMIKDRENGELNTHQTFAIRITKEKYDALRQDKMDDGVIDNDVLATKPRGTLQLDVKPGVSTEFITRW